MKFFYKIIVAVAFLPIITMASSIIHARQLAEDEALNGSNEVSVKKEPSKPSTKKTSTSAKKQQIIGWITEANPWRDKQDRKKINIEYTVQMEGIIPRVGMLLRANNDNGDGLGLGTLTGWLRVISATGQIFTAENLNLPMSRSNKIASAIQVGNAVFPENNLNDIGGQEVVISLEKVFLGSDSDEMVKNANKILSDKLKANIGYKRAIVAVFTDSEPYIDSKRFTAKSNNGGIGYLQATAVSEKISELLKIDINNIHAISIPISSTDSGEPRIVFRFLGSKK